MGQYYKLVNLTKKEIYDPNSINGIKDKLVEMASDEKAMNSLVVLLANGNGRGGGDIYINTCDTFPKKVVTNFLQLENENNNAYKKRLDTLGLKIDSSFKTSDKTCHLLIPKLSGTWAGDRIVVAGDYGDRGRYLPNLNLNPQEKVKVQKHYTDPDAYKTTKDIELYVFADANFKDITKDITKQIDFIENTKFIAK